MFKFVFLVVLGVIGYIAYTGVDVSDEYDAITNVRNEALGQIVDPLAKKVLHQVSESELDQKIETVIDEYYPMENQNE